MTIAWCRSGFTIKIARSIIAIGCAFALVPGDLALLAQQGSPPADQQKQTNAMLSQDQLDALVAPIALYPDPLLSQTLVASTYPLEVIQLRQWLDKNKGLKDQALVDAVKKQDWDPSIQALAALPDVVKRLSEDITWTTDLGNAFLAQQSDVMDAVQRMRKKAEGTGNLKSNEQQKVETKVVENKQVIVIEQAQPEVVYVPSYNPTVVYGAAPYPYPPLYYPPPGYYAAGMAISFGLGVAMGAAWGGGWGWGCGWGGGNNVYINNNNNFVNNSNRQNFQGGNRNRVNPQGRSNWQHNAQHRGGAPYSNRDVANRFGGTSRGDSRRNNGRNQGQRGNFERTSDRGGLGDGRQNGARDRNNDRGGGVGDRNSNRGAGVGDRSSDRGSNRGGGDRVGDRSTSRGGGSRGSSAFGSGGFSGSGARASGSRGASSMGGSRGGGRSGGRRR